MVKTVIKGKDLRILVVNAGPVYPVRAMNQMRTRNMILTLSHDFSVDLLAPVADDVAATESARAMKSLGGEFIQVRSVKHSSYPLRKRLAQIYELAGYYLFGTDREVTAGRWYNSIVAGTIRERGYDVVIGNYWEFSGYFPKLEGEVFRILDPHYSVAENFDVLSRKDKGALSYMFERRRLMKNLAMERAVVESSDLLLPLSERNLSEFRKIAPGKPMLLIHDGADLDYFLDCQTNPDPSCILFYGALGSPQNRGAFRRLWNNIFPAIKNEIPEARLLIVGSNPPPKISSLHNGNDVIVTGFVEDVRPYLAQAWISVLPLELGSGFRGRAVELMAMGIPVVGTHNALHSTGFESGVHGYVSDDDNEAARYCIKLMIDRQLRGRMSEHARQFAIGHYSLNATFGKLNEFLSDINMKTSVNG